MVCKKCSTAIIEGGIFCPNCGSRADGNMVCPKCEKLIPDNSIFCTYCGTRLVENKPEREETGIKKDSPQEDDTREVKSAQDNTDKVKDEREETKPQANAEMVAPVVPVIVPVAPVAVTNNGADSLVEKEEIRSEKDSNESSAVESIICSQCGSNDVDLISEELGKCRNCGTQIIINKSKGTNYVTNNVTIKMNGNDGDDAIGFFELPKGIDDKTFFVNALTKIALDKDSPEDIFIIGKFEPVKTSYRQYVLGKGTAQMTYSATVGYYRKVEYEEYNSISKKYETKTKKVTDWSPFSGNYTGEYIEAVANDGHGDVLDPDDYRINCLASSKEYDASTSKSPVPLPPSNDSLSNLESGIKTRAKFECKTKLPGDTYKDFYCDGVVSLTTVESHVAPQYSLKYKYLDTDYSLKAHACKKSRIMGDMPSAKKEIQLEIEHNKPVKSFNLITFFTLLFSILSAVLFPIALKIVFATVGIVSFITYWVIRSKVSKRIYLEKESKKKRTLIDYLKKKGIKIPKQLEEGVQA